MVSEVGRQPWIVYNLMKVEDAATANTGVWITFVLVAALYIGLGITTVLILRKMSRRFRERGLAEHEVPYGPREPAAEAPAARAGAGLMAETIAALLFAGVTAYAVFGGADFGAGFWDLVAGGPARGERPRR